jgi:hypothetical protein
VINHITHLLRTNDIICLQETHLGSLERQVLSLYFPSHHIFYNNLRRGRGGTLTIISPEFARSYAITEVPLSSRANGRVQVLRFSSRFNPSQPRSSFVIINVYLTSGHSGPALKSKYRELRTLRALTPDVPIFLAGDFNFVEHIDDSASGTRDTFLTGQALTEWDLLVDRLGLTEVHQPLDTFFRLASDSAHSRTSRLDRIYSSLTGAEGMLVNLSAFIPHTTYDPASAFQSAQTTHPGKKLGCFDHAPVSLVPSPTEARTRRGLCVPKWLAQVPGIAAQVDLLWSGVRAGESPFMALDRWKEAVRSACRAFFRDKQASAKHYGGDLALLGRAIHLFRACSRTELDLGKVQSILDSNTRLTDTVVTRDDGTLDTSGLERLME